MVVAQGTVADIAANPASLTGHYLREPLRHPMSECRAVNGDTPMIEILDADLHNLQRVRARIPVGRLSVLTGVSGSGKSTLARDVLLDNLARAVATRDTPAWRSEEHTSELQSLMRIS